MPAQHQQRAQVAPMLLAAKVEPQAPQAPNPPSSCSRSLPTPSLRMVSQMSCVHRNQCSSSSSRSTRRGQTQG